MPVCFPPAPPVHTNPKIEQQDEGTDVDSETSLNEVKSILITFLDSSTELGPKANDIKRRINMMEEMWTSGKLNKKIHLQMKDLAYGNVLINFINQMSAFVKVCSSVDTFINFKCVILKLSK